MTALTSNDANSLLDASVDNVVGVLKNVEGALYFLVQNHRVIRKRFRQFLLLAVQQVLLLAIQLLHPPESESL